MDKIKHLVTQSPSAGYAGLFVIFIFLIGLFAPVLGLPDPTEIALVSRNQPPGSQDANGNIHLLGTDHLGRDLLSRVIYGLRISLVVGLSAMSLGGLVGGSLGLLSGYMGRSVDNVIMRLVDIQMSFPYVLLAIIWATLWKGGLLNIIIIVGIRGWADYARIVRGSILSVKQEDYVLAARAIGASTPRIIFSHIIPQIIAPMVIVATFQIANVIILESTLSFFGLGIGPPNPSLGGILSDGRKYLTDAWWAVASAGFVLSVLTLSINVLGDGLRDALDPRLQQ